MRFRHPHTGIKSHSPLPSEQSRLTTFTALSSLLYVTLVAFVVTQPKYSLCCKNTHFYDMLQCFHFSISLI